MAPRPKEPMEGVSAPSGGRGGGYPWEKSLSFSWGVKRHTGFALAEVPHLWLLILYWSEMKICEKENWRELMTHQQC